MWWQFQNARERSEGLQYWGHGGGPLTMAACTLILTTALWGKYYYRDTSYRRENKYPINFRNPRSHSLWGAAGRLRSVYFWKPHSGLHLATVWMFVPPCSKFICWIPSPRGDDIGRGGLGRLLGHAGGAPMNGISVLLKETPQSSLTLSFRWGHSERSGVGNPEEGSHPAMLPPWPWLPASRTVSNTFLLFIRNVAFCRSDPKGPHLELLKLHYGDFPGGAVLKNPPANAGDTGLSPGPGRSHMPRSN